MKNYFKQFPNKEGYFGKYGGAFLPPQLVDHFKEITEAYTRISKSTRFISELRAIRKHYQGRPTPVYYAERLSDYIGGGRIYLKR